MSAKIKIIISMIIFGTISIFVRQISADSGTIALFRAAIAIVVLLIYKIIAKKETAKSGIKKELPLLFVSGALMGFNWILLFEAYRYTTVSVATLSYYFAPTLVVIVSALIFKEKANLKKLICFFLTTFGIILVILGENKSTTGVSFKGVALGLGAATAYACVVLINKRIRETEAIDRTVYQFASAAIVLLPYVLLSGGVQSLCVEPSDIVYIIIVGVVHTGIVYCLYFSSLDKLTGNEIAIFSYIDPAVAVFVSLTLLGEKMRIVQIIGGIMIILFSIVSETEICKKYRKNIEKN